MRTWVISRYNHGLTWLYDYVGDDKVVVYDRSEDFSGEVIKDLNYNWKVYLVENKGSDIYDKLTWIIDNYEVLPDVTILIKANLFDYIKPREFEKIKNNKTFTPILSNDHHTYLPVCFYKDGLYHEINNYWYLNEHPAKYAQDIIELFKMNKRSYNAFAPGSGYLLTKSDIQRHPKKLYKQLRSYLDWTIYPGDAQLLERNLYYLWGTDLINNG